MRYKDNKRGKELAQTPSILVKKGIKFDNAEEDC